MTGKQANRSTTTATLVTVFGSFKTILGLLQGTVTGDCSHQVQVCSRITRGRVLNGGLYVQRLQKLNLSAFIYGLIHGDFSPILGTNLD